MFDLDNHWPRHERDPAVDASPGILAGDRHARVVIAQRAEAICGWMLTHDHHAMVLAELLAADALGKMPTGASEVFRDFASERATDSPVLQMLLEFVTWSRATR